MKRFFTYLKILIITVILTGTCVVVNAQINWLQTGADIDGVAAGDAFGTAVSVSSNGANVAVGAYTSNVGASLDNGSVTVYENNSGIWVQKGQTLFGPTNVSYFGKSVELSADGSVLVVGGAYYPIGNRNGLVRVFEYSGGNWVQIGTDITGDNVNHQAGWSVSINDPGNIIAIGENVYDDGATVNIGRVRIFENQSGTWTNIGTLLGEAADDQFGQSVNLNAAGDILAVGASLNDENGSAAGHVRVFKYDGTDWNQIGADIDGGAAGDEFGWTVRLNGAGNILAASAPYSDNGGSNYGYVKVFEYSGGTWTLLGSSINGTAASELTGRYSVSINDDGDVVAVGGEGAGNGRVRVFEYSGGTWNIIGVPVTGEAAGDKFGYSVALSGDGTVFAAGGTGNNGGTGHVRVFTQTLNSTWTGSVSNDWNVAGNWDVNAVPVNGNYVFIPVDKVNYPTLAAAATCTDLTIESNATSTGSILGQANLTVSGITNVKRNMTGSAWHFLASTTPGQTIASFLSANTNIPLKNVSGTDRRGMMDYNEAGNIWNAFFLDVAQAGNLDAGKGYSIRTSADGEVIFAGALQGAAVNVPVTTAGPGWNCVGNPYPSAIFVNSAADATNNFITINDANFDPSYKAAYVWEQGNNAYTIVNNASPAFTAALGQAYMVKAKAGVTQFSFTTAMQTHAPTAALKSGMTSSPEVKLVASMTGAKASTLIKFDNDMTEGLDEGYDAGMFKTGFDLFTRLVKDNGVDFGLQCLPTSVLNKGEIVLGLQSTKSGEVSFSVETQNLPLNTRIVLEDRLKNTLTELTNGDVYTTQIDKAEAAKGRFFLHTSSSVTALDEFGAKADFRIYQADARIYIAGNVEGKAEAALFDVMGRTVSNIILENSSLNTISSAALKNGVYLLKIKHQKGIFSQKVMVKNQ